MIKTENFEQVEINAPGELHGWLAANHQQEKSVWVVTYKKAAGDKYVSTGEVLDELLAFGWIDGIRRKLDDRRTMQLISPRQVQYWTATYKARAARLIEQGRMQAPGYASIERGKASGLWNFMDDVDQLIIPEDLAAALDAHQGARDYFDTINDSSKRNALRHLKLAKTVKTRQKRIAKLAELSAKGERLPQS